ncbi:uncharacterized protein LOC112539767 [Tetranychus urticae]|nr:uncharacterized protein LOC112539767 [Tetranychus urticae]
MAELIRHSESLKGIIFDSIRIDCRLEFELMPWNANLEMLSIGYIDPDISGVYENVKQLHLCNSTLEKFKEVAHCFPNLERLRIYSREGLSEQYSDAPVLANLKIFEMRLPLINKEDTCCPFVFMDSCPALQSAHIRIDYSHFAFHRMIKCANLRDLVIQFYQPVEWNKLRKLMSKYPNLKHLALRYTSLKDELIKELISILPKLTLLDIRGSFGVTRRADNYVRDYCKRYGRSIKFYTDAEDKQIESDWPQSLNRPKKICRGFDFMEHCFFKDFGLLPNFLDPIDD